MELQKLRKNLKEIEKSDGTKVLISYRKPVAVRKPDGETLVSSTFFSKTTQDHIRHWLDLHELRLIDWSATSQTEIQKLAE